jgi:hypothetical protein
MKKIIFILVIGIVGSCKDSCPDPDTSGGSNGGTSGEYTVKVKIVNGTTGKTWYTDSKMHLKIKRLYGLGYVEQELVGSAYMDEEGGIEITYKHSDMGDRQGAQAILYGGPWAVGFNLPPNQDVDTTIYESTMGRIDVIINGSNIKTGDTLYFAHWDKEFDIDKVAVIDTITSPTQGLYKSKVFPKTSKSFWWGRDSEEFAAGLGKNRASIQLTGDPYVDTLTVEY